MTKRVIFNADDNGRTPSVAQGILEAHLNGAVTSSTMMMNMPFAREAIRLGKEKSDCFSLGVHLNLTLGKPLCDPVNIASIVDQSGSFFTRAELLQRVPSIEPEHVRREWTAQVDAFLESGYSPDHIDSHHHIAGFDETWLETYLELARTYDLALRPFLPDDFSNKDLERNFPKKMHHFLCECARQAVQTSELNSPDILLSGFFGSNASLDHLLSMLSGLCDGVTEIICHPGYSDAALARTSDYTHGREHELRLLSDPSLPKWIRAHDVELCSYRSAW